MSTLTRVVASVMAETPDELIERARRAATQADLVEIRLDGPSGLPWDLRPLFMLTAPTIATMRPEWEGGRSAADDATRADILRRALRAGAAYVDVELASDAAASLVADAHRMNANAIVSSHDFEGTPSLDRLASDLRAAAKLGADVAKLATRVESPADAARLVEAAMIAHREGIPCAIMAVNDPFLRLLAPALGLALAYGATTESPPTAAGQPLAANLRATHAALSRARLACAHTIQPSGTTRGAFLVGHPVSHSMSPAMQNAAFAAADVDAIYTALDVPPERLAAALQGLHAMGALGANLTIPHKIAALELVDDVAASARDAGAVNTLEFRDGRLVGHNTDGLGALDALREAGLDPRGVRALVLGAGGAGRGVAHALAHAGAEVIVANRTAEKATDLARELGAQALAWTDVPGALAGIDLLVNATSIGLRDATAPAPVDALAADATVLDCVYRPGGTPLGRLARARNLRVVAGESMLLHQGARAFTIWTGRPAPLAAMRRALEDAR